MFGREFRVDLVKKSTNEENTPEEDAAKFGSLAETVGFSVYMIGGRVAKGVAAYVVLDTVRQIAVNRLSK